MVDGSHKLVPKPIPLLFWTERKQRGLSELLLVGRGGWEIVISCQTDPGRRNQSSSFCYPPPPAILHLLRLAEFSFPDQVLTFVLEI